MHDIQRGQQDAIDWFKRTIADDPKVALTFLVAADLAISRGEAIEWCKPDHPAVVMYREATQS
jgi:hypothetical protein